MLVTFTNRHSLDLDVLRDRNPNFVTLADGAVRNAYTLKLMNRSDAARTFDLVIGGVRAREIKIIGVSDTRMPVRLPVEADKVRTIRVLVTVGKNDLQGSSQAITFALGDSALHETRNVETVFVSGGAE